MPDQHCCPKTIIPLDFPLFTINRKFKTCIVSIPSKPSISDMPLIPVFPKTFVSSCFQQFRNSLCRVSLCFCECPHQLVGISRPGIFIRQIGFDVYYILCLGYFVCRTNIIFQVFSYLSPVNRPLPLKPDIVDSHNFLFVTVRNDFYISLQRKLLTPSYFAVKNCVQIFLHALRYIS